MKKLVRSTVLAVVVLLLTVYPALASPCHNTISIDTRQCEEVIIDATYHGNNHRTNKVELYVDGNLVASYSAYKKNVSAHFQSGISPGAHSAIVKGYEKKCFLFWCWWELKDIDHRSFEIDLCYELCSQQIGPVYGPWSEWVLVGDTWERSRSVTFYDAYNQQYVCSSDVEYEYRPANQGCTDLVAENYNPEAEYDDGSCIYYEACSETIIVFEDWSKWESDGMGEGQSRTRLFTVYDARDRETVCDQYTDREHQCKKLFIMWLLEGSHPNASGPLQCYIVSPTHPSVDRYQRLCFPCTYPNWIASRAVAGWVDNCDNWSLDDERLYWRKPLAELLAMNARHAEGIYYPIECCEVE